MFKRLLCGLILCLAAPNTWGQQVVPDIPGGVRPTELPITALCAPGSPENFLMFLAETGEIPRYHLELKHVGMLIITESKRPSASVIIFNEHAANGRGASCWFWWTDANVVASEAPLPEIPDPTIKKERL